MNPKMKADVFGRRVNVWFVVAQLLAMKDDRKITGHDRKVVYTAIDIECDQQVSLLWERMEA